MTKAQKTVILIFAFGIGLLLWSLFYAITYDIRVYLANGSFNFAKSFTGVFSEDLLAPIGHAWQNWPSVNLLLNWFQDFTVINSLIALIPIFILLLIGLIIKQRIRPIDYHGDARLMNNGEMKKFGLSAKDGFYLGKIGRKMAIDEDQSHALIVGPPASGKTECLVIPNLIEWEGSFIAVDFKGTLFERTGKIRKSKGNDVYLLAPGFENTNTYNPLDLVRRDHNLITDIQALSNLITPVNDPKEAHWNQSAQMLLSGLLGYVIESRECESARNLSTIVDLFSATKSFTKTCENMLKDPDISEWTKARIIEFMAIPSEEAGSIRSTLNRHLTPWQNPVVASLTASTSNQIPLDQIRKKKLSIYLIIDTGQIDIFAPILKLFIEQVNSIVNRDYRADSENKILFMIDEFYQLGKVKSIISQLPFARDRDIRIVLVSQGIAQIDEKFSRDGRESIMASCALKLFCSFNDKPTVDLVMHTLGTSTERIATVSKQIPLFGGMARKTQNEQFIAKPMFRADDLYGWPRDDLLVLKTNAPPIILKKVLADKTAKYVKAYKKVKDLVINVPVLKLINRFNPTWGIIKNTQKTEETNAAETSLPPISEIPPIKEGEQSSGLSEGESIIYNDGELKIITQESISNITNSDPKNDIEDSEIDNIFADINELLHSTTHLKKDIKNNEKIEDPEYTSGLVDDLNEEVNNIKAILSA